MPRLSLSAQRIAVAASAVAALALAGCSDATSSPKREVAPETASLDQSPDVMDPTGRHVFHTKTWFDNPARDAKPGGGGATNTGIYYHGGTVLQAATNVVAIYWSSDTIFRNAPMPPDSSGSGHTDQSLLGDFLRGLGSSSYFKINTTYTDGSQPIKAVVNYNGFWANNRNAPSGTDNVSDTQMLAMLESGFKSGAITYNSATLYAIFTSGKVNLGGGYGSPPQYCAYHYHGTVNVGGVPQTVLYAAMPYNYAYPAYCSSGYTPANGQAGADFEVNTLAHEIEETTTDALGTAWFDHRGYENADKCAWTWGTTFTTTTGGTANVTFLDGKSYLIQRNWVNSGSGGCYQTWP